MRSSLFSSTVAVLAVCSNAAFGALTATQIAENINTLTSKSKDLQEPANSLNTVNGPLLAVGQGPFPVSTLAESPATKGERQRPCC